MIRSKVCCELGTAPEVCARFVSKLHALALRSITTSSFQKWLHDRTGPTFISEQEHWRSCRRGSVQLLEAKYAARDAIEEAGMKGIYVGTGMFLEWGLTQLFDWDSGKVRRRLSPKPGAPPARLC